MAFHGAYDCTVFMQAPLKFEGHFTASKLMILGPIVLTIIGFFVLRGMAKVALTLDDADAARAAAAHAHAQAQLVARCRRCPVQRRSVPLSDPAGVAVGDSAAFEMRSAYVHDRVMQDALRKGRRVDDAPARRRDQPRAPRRVHRHEGDGRLPAAGCDIQYADVFE